MKNFLPRLVLPATQPPQESMIPKIGGFPWGFPMERWPLCRECGGLMAHLAQFTHHPPVLDLGKEGNVLHLFQCNVDGVCQTWSDETGANAALLLEGAEMGHELTIPGEESNPLPEIWITCWQEDEDNVPPEKTSAFLDHAKYWDLPEDVRHPHGFDSYWDTKAGGVPYWTGNGISNPLPAPYQYLLQIGTLLFIEGQLPDGLVTENYWQLQAASGDRSLPCTALLHYKLPDTLERGDHLHPHHHYATVANFGSDGTAYVFIDREVTPPSVRWFWNR